MSNISLEPEEMMSKDETVTTGSVSKKHNMDIFNSHENVPESDNSWVAEDLYTDTNQYEENMMENLFTTQVTYSTIPTETNPKKEFLYDLIVAVGIFIICIYIYRIIKKAIKNKKLKKQRSQHSTSYH